MKGIQLYNKRHLHIIVRKLRNKIKKYYIIIIISSSSLYPVVRRRAKCSTIAPVWCTSRRNCLHVCVCVCVCVGELGFSFRLKRHSDTYTERHTQTHKPRVLAVKSSSRNRGAPPLRSASAIRSAPRGPTTHQTLSNPISIFSNNFFHFLNKKKR